MKRFFFFFILLFVSIGIVKADEWCYLKSLNVKNVEYDIGFSPKKYDYYLPVPLDVERLDLDYISTDGCLIEVEGNDYLKEGNNKILIILTNGEYETTYGITVNKHYMKDSKEPKKETFPIVYVGFGFAVAAIVIGVISVIHSKKTNKVGS